MDKLNQKQKDRLLTGLKKAKTSLNKIVKLVEETDDSQNKCFDVIQQNLAVIGLLKAANTTMLENYLDFYISNSKICDKKEKMEEVKKEILRIVQVAQKK